MLRHLTVLILIGCIASFSACKTANSEPEIIYIIPESFEGAVVVIYSQDDGIFPPLVDNKYVISIPKTGILKIKPDIGKSKGIPEFFTDGERFREKKLEYLFRRVPPDVPNGQTSADISESEANEKKFAMGYNSVNIDVRSGRIFVKRFLICRVKDANLVASVDLLEKLERVRNSFEH